jgi:hypothetical protein
MWNPPCADPGSCAALPYSCLLRRQLALLKCHGGADSASIDASKKVLEDLANLNSRVGDYLTAGNVSMIRTSDLISGRVDCPLPACTRCGAQTLCMATKNSLFRNSYWAPLDNFTGGDPRNNLKSRKRVYIRRIPEVRETSGAVTQDALPMTAVGRRRHPLKKGLRWALLPAQQGRPLPQPVRLQQGPGPVRFLNLPRRPDSPPPGRSARRVTP